MTFIKRTICAFLACLMLLSSGIIQAYAAVPVDPSRVSSLSIHYSCEGQNVPGAVFKIYRVAQISGSAQFTPVAPFDAYPIPLSGHTTESWNELALTIQGYVSADGIAPTVSGATDEGGNAVFNDLSTGLYLILSDKKSYSGYTYVTVPSLLSIPNYDKNSDDWIYDINILPKSSRSKNPDPPSPSGGGGNPVRKSTMRKVLIEWDDEGSEDKRPESVTVYLLKDGVVYDTEVISAGCDWRYTWYDIPEYDDKGSRIVWTVTEDAPAGYTVQRGEDGITTIMIHEIPNRKATKSQLQKLPQTGLLWWPVPLLFCLGIILIIAGVLIRRSSED